MFQCNVACFQRREASSNFEVNNTNNKVYADTINENSYSSKTDSNCTIFKRYLLRQEFPQKNAETVNVPLVCWRQAGLFEHLWWHISDSAISATSGCLCCSLQAQPLFCFFKIAYLKQTHGNCKAKMTRLNADNIINFNRYNRRRLMKIYMGAQLPFPFCPLHTLRGVHPNEHNFSEVGFIVGCSTFTMSS